MPRVTALTAEPAGTHVVVEVDGARWRRIPADVAARVGLSRDSELGRGDLRALRRELRRAEAIDAATRALVHRDRSRAAVLARLRAAGISPWAAGEALETLERAGIVDDGRFARSRAAALAARGSGDALIEDELRSAGVSEDDLQAALGALDPERERAIRVTATRGESPATARWLARRGFGQDAIEAALPTVVADEP
ncbi:MAG TPA: RecX family transcriptional regulator [Gaiellaceae bacterium]|nr:RecX family transcriptional regulator [Gaiellaceae bacterium]